MMSIVPTKILTVEDCEMKINTALLALENPETSEDEAERLNASVMIWEPVLGEIENGNTITFDLEERFGHWGKAN